MQATQFNAKAKSALPQNDKFPPLALVNLPAVPTEQAAHYLLRRPQTLRFWACKENGPIRPIRVYGRLAWPVSELRRVLEAA